MPQYLCSLPNEKTAGRFPELITDDPAAIAAFVKKYDVPGRAVYRCVNPLKPGAHRRNIENVGPVERLCVDLDFKDLVATPEEIDAKLLQLPLEPAEVRNSGGGRHIVYELNEPIDADDEVYFSRAREVLKRLTVALSGDPAPAHPAALLREANTHNSKRGNPVLVKTLWGSGRPVDITDIEAMLDLLPDDGLFARKPITNGHDTAAAFDRQTGKPPIDVDERLAAMCFEGPGENSIHQTQLGCTAALLRSGCMLDDTVITVLEATRKAVEKDPRAASWRWGEETVRLEGMCFDFISKHPELSILLPDEFREPFEDAAAVADGKNPWFVYNKLVSKWHMRTRKAPKESGHTEDKAPPNKAARSFRFKLGGVCRPEART